MTCLIIYAMALVFFTIVDVILFCQVVKEVKKNKREIDIIDYRSNLMHNALEELFYIFPNRDLGLSDSGLIGRSKFDKASFKRFSRVGVLLEELGYVGANYKKDVVEKVTLAKEELEPLKVETTKKGKATKK